MISRSGSKIVTMMRYKIPRFQQCAERFKAELASNWVLRFDESFFCPRDTLVNGGLRAGI